MDAPGDDGARRHWILEVHLLDPTESFGGFFEGLLLTPDATDWKGTGGVAPSGADRGRDRMGADLKGALVRGRHGAAPR